MLKKKLVVFMVIGCTWQTHIETNPSKKESTMKNLQSYVQEKQTALFNQTGAFFAFSPAQFCERMQKGIKYTQFGCGLICPTSNVETLVTGLEKISTEGIAQDIEENGVEAIIIRELYNYECFYTGSITDVVEALAGYGISKEQIRAAFLKEAQDKK